MFVFKCAKVIGDFTGSSLFLKVVSLRVVCENENYVFAEKIDFYG